MRVRAISLASVRSNVVGTIEIECSPAGLSITYVDAALLGDQGVPVAIDAGRNVSVSWSQVRDARVLGDAVAFEIDPTPWPPQRLLLVRFEATRSTSPHRIFRRRLATRAIGLGLALVVTLGVMLILPRAWPEMGCRPALSIGSGLGLLVVGLGIVIDGLVATGGLRSRIVRELFIGELLGFVPELPRDPTPVTAKNVRWPRVGGVAPRATLAVSLVLGSMLLLAVAMPHRAPAQGGPVPARPDEASVAVGSASSAGPAVPLASYAQIVGPCDCPRGEGPLWNEPMPRISLLTVSSRSFQRSGRSHVELELAAVNNGSRDVADLAAVIEFSQDDKQPWSKPVNVSVRAVYHKTLVSGAAVKWRVEAEGETIRIRAPTSRGLLIEGTVNHDGEGAAPTSAIAELLEARSLAVRLHGAMLLAFLSDPHAKDAITKLQNSVGDAEKVYLNRIIETIGELRTCRVVIATEGAKRRLSACITNTTDSRAAPVDITFRALDKPAALRAPRDPAPEVLMEWMLGVPGEIAAQSGIEVRADVDLAAVAKPPGAFEAVARLVMPKPQ
jgi:hypothetical protein